MTLRTLYDHVVSNSAFFDKLIHVIYWARSVRLEKKSVPEVLSTVRGRRPRAVLKTKGTVFFFFFFFPIRTDLAR